MCNTPATSECPGEGAGVHALHDGQGPHALTGTEKDRPWYELMAVRPAPALGPGRALAPHHCAWRPHAAARARARGAASLGGGGGGGATLPDEGVDERREPRLVVVPLGLCPALLPQVLLDTLHRDRAVVLGYVGLQGGHMGLQAGYTGLQAGCMGLQGEEEEA